MLYECDDTNCAIGEEHCNNRAFRELKLRYKQGGRFNMDGVELLQTEEKGIGLRASRPFKANQIIIEYAGEIITQDECERRMKKEYRKNKVCTIRYINFNLTDIIKGVLSHAFRSKHDH
jgi:SET domain-containing protein